MGRRHALVALVLCLSACGGGERASSDAPGGHRALPELELWGHLRNDPTGLATSAPLGALGFDAIRQSTDKAHALVHVSGFT